MRRIAVFSLAIAGLSLSSPALASEDNQAWETLNVSVALPSHFKLSSETVRRAGNAKGFYELEENLMVGYQADPHVTLWLGYTHNPQYTHGDFTVMEHRFRQQVNFDNVAKLGPMTLSGRMRLEERWRNGVSGTGWRLRPAIKLSMPLVGKTKLSLNHESFIDLNTASFQTVGGYERMRNAISVSAPLGKKFGVEVGYLNQYKFVPNGPNSSDNVLTLALSASF
jgi:hypothetical protein